MFRVIKGYDGSDSDKCISLTIGDQLMSVHTIDESWYIGHNQRSGETGVFPVWCVTEGARSDNTTLQGIDGNTEAEIFTIPHVSSGSSSISGNTFGPPKVQHSLSIPESDISWHESSFEDSFQDSMQHESAQHKDNHTKVVTFEADEENSFHKFKNDKLNVLWTSTDKLFHSDREENKTMKAVFGVAAGFGIGGLLFILLFFSFGYSELMAGITVAVLTISICIGLALSSICRCIMALIFPNFFTGKGRAVLLSVIFGVMLTGPIFNITHNSKDMGSTMACIIDLIANQTRVLKKQSVEPIKNFARQIDQQREALNGITDTISIDFDEVKKILKVTEDGLNTLNNNMDVVYQKCREPIVNAVRDCVNTCNKFDIGGQMFSNPLKKVCLTQCSNLNELTDICSSLHIGGNFEAVRQEARYAVDKAESFFKVDIKVEGNFNTETNSSKDADTIQHEVNHDIESRVSSFQDVMKFTKYILSVSVFLMFLQAFLYFKNYMAKDGYDNNYITQEFMDLDKQKDDAVLPLKKKERSEYIHAKSFRLNQQELAYCRMGLIQVLLHSVCCIAVVLFDYLLYYILKLVHRFGTVEIDLNNEGRLKVIVDGKGPLASFYRAVFTGIDVYTHLSSNINIRGCLPNPSPPSGDYVIVFVVLYILAMSFVILRGYGMRLRRKIAAYYYPEQEAARMEYLHKTIRHKRIAHQTFLRQEVTSTHKESVMKEKFRLSTWLVSHCPCASKCAPSRRNLGCISCEERPGNFKHVNMTQCTGERGGVPCTAIYCDACRAVLNDTCPLCSHNDVEFRDY